MLADAGSVASIVGVAVSLGGFGLAIWQLSRLRGETRAAKEAAAATERALRRQLTSTELTRLGERIQALVEVHRRGDRTAALAMYSEIREMFLQIRRSHPGLSEQYRAMIQRAITEMVEMERSVEGLAGDITRELGSDFNRRLRDFQLSVIPLLEDQLST